MVFVLSSSVRVPIAELAISNGLRPGLAGVVKTLADELGPAGIRVNGLLPARIATDRVRELDALARRSRRGAGPPVPTHPAAQVRRARGVRAGRRVPALPCRVLHHRRDDPGGWRRHPLDLTPAAGSSSQRPGNTRRVGGHNAIAGPWPQPGVASAPVHRGSRSKRLPGMTFDDRWRLTPVPCGTAAGSRTTAAEGIPTGLRRMVRWLARAVVEPPIHPSQSRSPCGPSAPGRRTASGTAQRTGRRPRAVRRGCRARRSGRRRRRGSGPPRGSWTAGAR